MPAVRSLIAAHQRGDAGSLRALAVALAATVHDTPEPGSDPVEAWAGVEDRGGEQAGTWQEVRAARDHGDLTAEEYSYLVEAVDALTQEADE